MVAGRLEAIEGAADEFSRAVRNLDGDVVRNVAAIDQAAHEIELGLRGGGEGDFNFLEADGAKCLEHAHLLLAVHRLEQRLVAVAEIGTHPDRRPGDGAVRPLAVDELDRWEGVVLGAGSASGTVPERLGFDGSKFTEKSGRQVLA